MAENTVHPIVILCRVQDSSNIGSLCRAMKTMGFFEMRLADCPDYDLTKVRTLAVHSFDIYENSARFANLADALADTTYSAGFTRRTGKKRDKGNLLLEDFAAKLSKMPTPRPAIVFGNEADGLSDEELALCTLSVHIQTNPTCPSLNVAQAVQIACYELTRSALRLASSQDKKTEAPLRRLLLEARIGAIAKNLEALGMFKISDSSHATRFLRDLCERASLEEAEIEYLGKLLGRTAALQSGVRQGTKTD